MQFPVSNKADDFWQLTATAMCLFPLQTLVPFYVLFVHVIVWTSTMSKHPDGMTHAGILLFAQGQYLINASDI